MARRKSGRASSAYDEGLGAVPVALRLVVIVSCTIVLGGLSVFTTLNAQEAISGELSKLAKVTSQRLSKHLIGPMWDLDNDLVDATIEAEMLEDNIHAIVIWDGDTKEVANLILRMQLRATQSVITATTGLVLLKVERALNKILSAIAKVVNTAIGFPLIAGV